MPSSPDPTTPESSRPSYPVGLRLLGFLGSPFRRVVNGPRRPSLFLFPVVSTLVLLAAIYVIGAALAWHEGVLGPFLANPLLPALLLATGWAAVWIAWAASVYVSWGLAPDGSTATSPWVPPLRLTPELRRSLDGHWRRLCSIRTSARYALPCIAILVTYAYLAIYPPWGLSTLAPPSILALYAYPNQSYWMFVYLACVAAILADVGSYGLFFTFEHLRFVSEFIRAERPVLQTGASTTVRLVYLARKPLKELAEASFLSSMGWFGVVAILAAVFVVDLNLLTLVGLGAVVVLGLYVFFRPQWEFHQLIRSAKQVALRNLESSLGEDWCEPGTNAPKKETLPTLALLQNVSSMSEWHVDLELVVAQVLGAALPFVAAFASGPLGLRIG